MTPSATAAPCHLPHGGRHRGSISTRRRTSPKGAKSAGRGAPHFPVIPKRSEESPRSLSLARGSLHSTSFRVRDDVRKYACWDDMRGSTPHPPSPPLCKGMSRALCASPRCGVRAWRTEVFAIVGKNRDRWRRPPPRPWQAIEKSRQKGCPAHAAPTFTTLPPRSARHPPFHREGKGRRQKASPATSRKRHSIFAGQSQEGRNWRAALFCGRVKGRALRHFAAGRAR